MPMTRAAIDRALADVRSHGFALRDSYFGSGLRTLAVPVLDIDHYPMAAISVAAPAIRVSAEEFRARTLEPLQRAAAAVARAIQASGTISATR